MFLSECECSTSGYSASSTYIDSGCKTHHRSHVTRNCCAAKRLVTSSIDFPVAPGLVMLISTSEADSRGRDQRNFTKVHLSQGLGLRQI